MAFLEIAETCARRPSVRLVVAMPPVLATWVRWRRRRRLLRQLARLSDHLIRDAGFDPDVVRAEVAGTWDVALPGRDRGIR